MESLPYDNLEELALYLQSIFKGDQLTVQKAQTTLSNMAKDQVRFTDSLIRIITNETCTTEFNRIKRAACISLEKLLTPLFDRKGNNYDVRTYILESIIKALYSSNVPASVKGTFQTFLKVIFHQDKKDGKFKQDSMAYAIQQMQKQQVNDYAASLIIMRSVLEDSVNPAEHVAEWWNTSYETLVIAGNALTEGIGSEILDIVKGNLQKEKLEHIYIGLEILQLWTVIIGEYIKRLGRNDPRDLTKPNYLDIVVDKEDLVRLLLKAMILQIPAGEQIKECMFATSDIPQLDRLLNIIKTKILRCFESILEFKTDAIIVSLHPSSAILNPEINKFYYHIANDGIKAILQSLYHLSRAGYHYIEGGLKNQEFHECVCQSLVILTQLVPFKDLYPLFAEYKNTIIMDIGLAIAATTKEELKKFAGDPQGFLSLTIGIWDENETMNSSAKLQAIYLLQKLCHHIDGATSFLLGVSETLIEFSLHSNNVADIATNYPRLKDFEESAIVKGIEPNIRVETALLVMAGLFAEVRIRIDLIYIIDNLLTTYHKYFLEANTDVLVKSRVCLIFGVYSAELFLREENKHLFIEYLKFVVLCLDNQHENEQALVEQAVDTIQDMIAEKNTIYRLVPFIVDLLQDLATLSVTTSCISFFDAIRYILKVYSPTLVGRKDVIIKFMECLVERARLEYEENRKSKGAPKLVLTKIWNIILYVGQNKDYIPQLQEEIETILSPLFAYLETDDDVSFDEEILNYVNSSIKLTKRITPVIWTIFKLFPKIFDQRKSLITPLFPALNQIIVHGKDEIEANNETKHLLVEMGIRGLNPKHPDAGSSAPAMAALHFQILIQYIGIPDEDMQRMLLACLEKLCDSKKGKIKGFIKVRLAGVFLLSFLRNFELTQAVLVDQNALGAVMDIFTKEASIFENSTYDRKVFLIGLCKFLTQPNANPAIVEKLPQIFDILITYLKYVTYIDLKAAKKGGKKRKNLIYETDSEDESEEGLSDKDCLKIMLAGTNIHAAFGDDSEEEEEEDDDEDDEDIEEMKDEIYFPNERGEVNYYARHMEAGIKDQDEFAAFKEAINELKVINQQLLLKLTGSLSADKKETLKSILQSSRVATNQVEGGTATRKIVKTVAGKIRNLNKDQ